MGSRLVRLRKSSTASDTPENSYCNIPVHKVARNTSDDRVPLSTINNYPQSNTPHANKSEIRKLEPPLPAGREEQRRASNASSSSDNQQDCSEWTDSSGEVSCVKFDYLPPFSRTGHLSVCRGDYILVLERQSDGAGWCYVVNSAGEAGWVPANHIAPISVLPDCISWYHGNISKAESERALTGCVAGSFLVRDSESVAGRMTLSVVADGPRVYHYHIHKDEAGKLHVNMSCAFNSVADLVQYHSLVAGGLVVPLMFPVAPQTSATGGGGGGQLLCSSFSMQLIAALLGSAAPAGPDALSAHRPPPADFTTL